MKYNFTYIIGYRHNIERFVNLRKVLEWLSGFNNIEVILVEQDTHSKIDYSNIPVNHIFIKSNMPYNRSWAFNVGLKHSNSDIIVFGDSDLIMCPNAFINALNQMNEYDMISPYNSVIDLDIDESNRLSINDILNINREGRGDNDNQKINISGGISIWRKDSIYKVAGWCEDFWCWGGEDDFQTMKVKHILKYKELPGRCYHLYHSKVIPDRLLYSRNLQILNDAAKMSLSDINNHINYNLSKIGMKNKCDNF